MKIKNFINIPPEFLRYYFSSPMIPRKVSNTKVYRYMEEQFVKEFLTTGRLRLTALRHFAENDKLLKAQHDPREGVLINSCLLENDIDRKAIYIYNAYILSTSQVLDKKIADELHTDATLVIKNTKKFADYIAKELKGCLQVLVRNCTYHTEDDLIIRHPKAENKRLKATGENIMNFHIAKVIGANIAMMPPMVEGCFMKSIYYEYQKEHRMIWCIDSSIQDNYIFITLPQEARDLCEAIYF